MQNHTWRSERREAEMLGEGIMERRVGEGKD